MLVTPHQGHHHHQPNQSTHLIDAPLLDLSPPNSARDSTISSGSSARTSTLSSLSSGNRDSALDSGFHDIEEHSGESGQNPFSISATKRGGNLLGIGASFEEEQAEFVRRRDGSNTSTIVDDQSPSNRQSQVSFDESTKTGSSSSSEDDLSDEEAQPNRKKAGKSHSFKNAFKSKTLGLKGKIKMRKHDRPKSMPEADLRPSKPERSSSLFKRAKGSRSKQSGARTYQEIDESLDYLAVTPDIPKDQVDVAVEKTPKGWWLFCSCCLSWL